MIARELQCETFEKPKRGKSARPCPRAAKFYDRNRRENICGLHARDRIDVVQGFGPSYMDDKGAGR